MRYIFLLIILFIATLAYALELPDGWRLPTEKELASEPLRLKSPTKNAKVEADFNGDGKIDYALLLKSTKFSGECFAVNYSKGNEYSWQILSEIDWGEEYPNVNLSMGIDLAKPKRYKTACGKGYWECEPGEPEVLELMLPGIWYFKFESAASLWFWDSSLKSFKSIAISD